MDPITTAIIAAVAAGAGKVGEKVIVDAYDGLKELISRKLGVDNKVSKAIDELEAEPDFEPNKTALDGRMKQAKVNEDPEITAAAQDLLEKLKDQSCGQQITTIDQTVTNVKYAATSATGDATISNIKEN